jgi:hypothetical protein
MAAPKRSYKFKKYYVLNFLKVSNFKFPRNLSSGSGADKRGQTDGHDEDNKLFATKQKRVKSVHAALK